MRPTRVLIVDDNRDAADMTAALLGAEGFQTETAYNGRDALAADGRFRPDVVLLDLTLPDVDGFEVAERLRDDPPPPLLIAVSGHAEDHVADRLRASGCARHLLKPIDVDALLKLLADVPPRET